MATVRRLSPVTVALLVLAVFLIPAVLPTPSALAKGPFVAATVALPAGGVPYYAAYDSGKGEIFVANNGNNTVTVISDASNAVVATVNVGTGPQGVAYDSAKGEVFVANQGANTVS